MLDNESIAKAFEEHYPVFLSVAAQNLYVRLKRDAEDVVQEAFLSALRQLDAFRGECALKSWLCVIIQRTAWKHNKDSEPTLSDYAEVGGLDVKDNRSSVLNELEAMEILGKVLPLLSTKDREFLSEWREGVFDGQMNVHQHRNRLSRAKKRMQGHATKIGILDAAA